MQSDQREPFTAFPILWGDHPERGTCHPEPLTHESTAYPGTTVAPCCVMNQRRTSAAPQRQLETQKWHPATASGSALGPASLGRGQSPAADLCGRPQTFNLLAGHVEICLAKAGPSVTTRDYRACEVIYRQGDASSDVLFVQLGLVKYSLIAESGDEAVPALYGSGDLFGEDCLAGQACRTGSTIAIERTRIMAVGADVLRRLLANDPALSEQFLAHILRRNLRLESSLLDQMFNPTEKRLARVLLLLACQQALGVSEQALDVSVGVVPRVSQATLAEMVGTTRSRVNVFLNQFRRRGLIAYDNDRSVRVNGGLRMVLNR